MDWSGTLRQRWWVDLLTIDGLLIQELDGVTEVSVDYKVAAAVRGAGSLTVRAESIDEWRNRQVRIWVETIDQHGEADVSAILTAMLEVGDEDRNSLRSRLPVKLLDRTVQLNAHLATTMSCPTGTVITTQIREWAQLLRLGQIAITESSATTSKDMSWPPGTTWRAVFSALCDAAGYGAIYSDAMGTLQCHPYVAPSTRPVVEILRPGRRAIHQDAVTIRTNATAIPNHLILIASQGADTEALVAERWDWTGTPWSVDARSREVSIVDQVEAVTQDVLEAQADSRWTALRGGSVRTSLRWRWHPRTLMDRLTVTTTAPRVSDRTSDMTIQSMSVKAQAGRPLGLVDVELTDIGTGDDAPTGDI